MGVYKVGVCLLVNLLYECTHSYRGAMCSSLAERPLMVPWVGVSIPHDGLK